MLEHQNAEATADIPAMEEGTPKGVVNFPPLPGIPYRRYFDQDFADLELEHVFRKQWLFVACVSDFPKTGSYKQVDIPFAPVLVIRGRDGELRAFLNSCQHRGSTVLRDKQGCTPVMSCQYHGWTYDLTGKLIGVTSSSCFPGLKKADHPLPQLRCEQWGELVFVNFDMDAEPLAGWLAQQLKDQYGEAFSVHPERPLRLFYEQSWEVECNWKAIVENFWETYHFHFIHKESVGTLIDSFRSVPKLYKNGHGEILSPFRNRAEAQWKGLVSGEDHTKTALAKMPNMPDELVERLGHENVEICLFPNSLINLQPSGFVVVEHFPLAADRALMLVKYYGEDWGEGDPPPAYADIVVSARIAAEEDMSCMNSIQASMKANPDGKVYLGGQEAAIYNNHAEIDRCIGRDRIASDAVVEDTLRPFAE